MPKKSKRKIEPAGFVKERKDLIGRLLKDDIQINWIIELSITKYLIKHYPDISFWNQFTLPPSFGRIDSLRLLRGAWGREFLRQEWNRYNYTNAAPKTQLTLLDDKLGEDVKITKKPRTIQEFLNV